MYIGLPELGFAGWRSDETHLVERVERAVDSPIVYIPVGGDEAGTSEERSEDLHISGWQRLMTTLGPNGRSALGVYRRAAWSDGPEKDYDNYIQ